MIGIGARLSRKHLLGKELPPFPRYGPVPCDGDQVGVARAIGQEAANIGKFRRASDRRQVARPRERHESCAVLGE
jgi:hypothetical protein